jgi:hypothetical protein
MTFPAYEENTGYFCIFRRFLSAPQLFVEINSWGYDRIAYTIKQGKNFVRSGKRIPVITEIQLTSPASYSC